MVVVEDFFGLGESKNRFFCLLLLLMVAHYSGLHSPPTTFVFPPNAMMPYYLLSFLLHLDFSLPGGGKQGVWGVKSLHMCPLGREMKAVWRRWGGEFGGLGSVLCIVFEVPCGIGWRLAKRDRTGPIFGSDCIVVVVVVTGQ